MAPAPQLPTLLLGLGMIWRLLVGTKLGRVILALAVAAPFVAFVLSASRFCFANGQFLTEQAAIDAEVDRLIAARRLTVNVPHDGSATSRRLVTVIPYHDRVDFYRRNPDCCVTNVGGKVLPYPGFPPGVDATDRLLGRATYAVSVTLAVHYRDEDGAEKIATVTSNVPITNCGQLWRAF